MLFKPGLEAMSCFAYVYFPTFCTPCAVNCVNGEINRVMGRVMLQNMFEMDAGW